MLYTLLITLILIYVQLKRVAEALMLVKQKQYPGMSGWTYDDKTGFGVTETNRSEWKELTKVHKIFKPFAT
jgi:hypothetical protein